MSELDEIMRILREKEAEKHGYKRLVH